VRTAGAALAAALLLACNGAAAGDPAMSQQRAPAPNAGASQPAIRFDSARAWKDLEAQVGFGPRPAGSAALQKTRDYLLAELKKAGVETRQQIFIARTPLGETSMANLIATIPGRRPERIAIASHYDTKLFREIRFVGASDGASSTAALLELARALKGRQNEFTIELLFFDGEEAVVKWDSRYRQHLRQPVLRRGRPEGRHAQESARARAARHDCDKNLVIRRDAESTPWLVDIVWAAAARIGHRGVFSNELTTIEDDHIPFVRAGVPAVDIIDLDYLPMWHTAADNLENVSAKSLQMVGDVVLAALPDIEAKLR
jgi:hypothetical protein